MANNVTEGSKIQHINEGCDYLTIEAPMNEIVALSRNGDIPVLRIGTDDGYNLNLRARSAANSECRRRGGKYVCISHVWADGLGAPNTNTITQCQLTRIADRIGKLEATEACGELGLWIDTLCIPVASEFQELRDMQIRRMSEVYMDAYAVMVMDADTLGMKHKSTTELVVRLGISAWCSRLWTYQEAALNSRVLVMTVDDIVDLDEEIQMAKTSMATTETLSHEVMYCMTYYMIEALGRSRFYEDLYGTSVLFNLMLWLNFAYEQSAGMLLLAIGDRTSSRTDDEAIIIGTALQLNVAHIVSAAQLHRTGYRRS